MFEFYISQIVYPSKHDFFLRIARLFLFVTHLTVLGNRILNNADESSDQMTSVVEFHHLTSLTIHFQRAIYVEQFLVHTNTHLPNLIDLTTSYDNLVSVTENFKRDITHLTIRTLSLFKISVLINS
jgi:hypothetical protein